MFAELVVLAVSLYFIWMVMDNFFPSIKNPPGPFRLPIVGNGFSLLTNRHQPPFIKFRDWTKKYGGVVYIRMGTEDTVLIDDFDTAKTILNSETWVDRPWDDFMAERSYGQQLGVIFSIGETWKEMRRFTTRSLRDFGFGKQTYMQSIMDDQLKQLLEKLEKVSNKNEPLKIKYLFTLSVLNILWGMVSSVRASGDEEKLKKLLVIVDKLARATPIGGTILDIFPELRHILPGPTGATFIRNCNKEQQDYFQEALDARRKEIQEEDSRDFIDLFIKEMEKHKKQNSNPNHYTDEQFVTILMDLFQAGSETSSNTLEFAFYFAIKNQKVQEKVQSEIDRVVGRSRYPNTADRPNMPYTEATLLEVQRMANVLPMTGRRPTENCKVNGYDVKKGTLGVVNIYSIHMDKTFWGDPFTFRPERFLDENNQFIQSKVCRVIPFGAGKRVCLGEQMARTTLFMYFTTLLQNYKFKDDSSDKESLSDSANAEEFMFSKVTHVGFTLSPYPYQARITKR